MENKRTFKNTIQRCGSDKILPMAIVYMFYIILHGHLSPGGGFQGGILAVAVVVLIYFGHGYETTARVVPTRLLSGLEGLALVIYVALAMLGVAFGAQFCQNIAYLNGDIGALLSSGTISWTDEAVAFNVVTGSSVLAVTMLGVLMAEHAGEKK